MSYKPETNKMKVIMKPILKHGMDVSIQELEAYLKVIQELINLRKVTGGETT